MTKANRQELIVEKASELFITQGYRATSVRQIADAAGVTDAALYYHFKDGKRALFQAVLEANLPDFLRLIEPCRGAKSLGEIMLKFGGPAPLDAIPQWVLLSWIISEFPHLSPEEQNLVQQTSLLFQNELRQLIVPFVGRPEQASDIAWLMIMLFFGYAQTFVSLQLGQVADFPFEKLKANMATLFQQP